MQMEKGSKRPRPQAAGSVLQELFSRGIPAPTQDAPFKLENGPPLNDRQEAEGSGRYDFDLAEFPVFRFCKPLRGRTQDELAYSDTICGKDGQVITREWKVFPG